MLYLMDTCKNCGKEIKFETSPVDDYWFHVETKLVWCYGFGGNAAESEENP